jgi:methanogenic corrinoid protein MtbC1/DNA-binding XRE family transcriptional regulator
VAGKLRGETNRADPVHRYVDALLGGDEDAAAVVVTNAVAAGMAIADVYTALLTPAMIRVGDLWRRRRIDVAQQKLATQITLNQMDRLRATGARKTRLPYRALVCCVEGETHSTGARMAADLLRLEGWSVDFLGADVPVRDVVALVQRREPNVLALSVTMQGNIKHVRRLLDELRRMPARPKIIIGGQGAARLTPVSITDLDCNIAPGLSDGVNLAMGAIRSLRPTTHLETYLNEIGRRIRELRIKNGQTQAELAGSAGLNRAYIVSVERGKQNISMSVVVKIANALGVSIEELLLAS